MKSGDRVLPQARLHEELALLAAYLLSSGRGLLEEPADYGAYRCTDAARRVLDLLEQTGGHNPGLHAVRRSLDDVMFAPMGGDVDMAEILDGLCERLIDALREPAADKK